jgi:hypothetical protein
MTPNAFHDIAPLEPLRISNELFSCSRVYFLTAHRLPLGCIEVLESGSRRHTLSIMPKSKDEIESGSEYCVLLLFHLFYFEFCCGKLIFFAYMQPCRKLNGTRVLADWYARCFFFIFVVDFHVQQDFTVLPLLDAESKGRVGSTESSEKDGKTRFARARSQPSEATFASI